MKEYIENLQIRYSELFGRNAQEYLGAGLSIFHRYRDKETEHAQAAVGAMIAGVEFLIKSILAYRNLSNVFSDLPHDVRIFFTSPDSVPRFFKWRNIPFDIHSPSVKIIGFDQCMASFNIFFPHMKQPLMSHAGLLSRLREPSLHGIVPALNSYDLGRVGMTVLAIAETIGNEETFPYTWYSLSGEDTAFVREFEELREERVRLALSQAKRSAHDEIHDGLHTVVARGWKSHATSCPVCRSEGLLDGYTELAMADDEEGAFPSLDFFAVSFRCDECRLKLYDFEEMKIAGMDTLYDRSDDIDQWFHEFGDLPEWDI